MVDMAPTLGREFSTRVVAVVDDEAPPLDEEEDEATVCCAAGPVDEEPGVTATRGWAAMAVVDFMATLVQDGAGFKISIVSVLLLSSFFVVVMILYFYNKE